jgi:hypothetical protein
MVVMAIRSQVHEDKDDCWVKSLGQMTRFTQSSEKFHPRQNCMQSRIYFMILPYMSEGVFIGP